MVETVVTHKKITISSYPVVNTDSQNSISDVVAGSLTALAVKVAHSASMEGEIVFSEQKDIPATYLFLPYLRTHNLQDNPAFCRDNGLVAIDDPRTLSVLNILRHAVYTHEVNTNYENGLARVEQTEPSKLTTWPEGEIFARFQLPLLISKVFPFLHDDAAKKVLTCFLKEVKNNNEFIAQIFRPSLATAYLRQTGTTIDDPLAKLIIAKFFEGRVGEDIKQRISAPHYEIDLMESRNVTSSVEINRNWFTKRIKFPELAFLVGVFENCSEEITKLENNIFRFCGENKKFVANTFSAVFFLRDSLLAGKNTGSISYGTTAKKFIDAIKSSSITATLENAVRAQILFAHALPHNQNEDSFMGDLPGFKRSWPLAAMLLNLGQPRDMSPQAMADMYVAFIEERKQHLKASKKIEKAYGDSEPAIVHQLKRLNYMLNHGDEIISNFRLPYELNQAKLNKAQAEEVRTAEVLTFAQQLKEKGTTFKFKVTSNINEVKVNEVNHRDKKISLVVIDPNLPPNKYKTIQRIPLTFLERIEDPALLLEFHRNFTSQDTEKTLKQTELFSTEEYEKVAPIFALRAKGDYTSALTEAQKLEATTLAENSAFCTLLASLHHRQKNLSLAEEWYKKAMKIKPDDALSHRQLAIIYIQLENYPQAELHIDLARQIDPSRFQKTVDDFFGGRDATSIKPRDILNAIKISTLLQDAYKLQNQDDFSEAMKLIEKVREVEPSFLAANVLKSQVLYKQGKYSEALEIMKPLKYADIGVFSLYISTLYMNGDKEYLLQEVERAPFNVYNNSAILYPAAMVMAEKGDWEKALPLYKKLAWKLRFDSDAWERAAYLAIKNGHFDEANNYLNIGLGLEPKVETQLNIIYMQLHIAFQQGNLEETEKLSRMLGETNQVGQIGIEAVTFLREKIPLKTNITQIIRQTINQPIDNDIILETLLSVGLACEVFTKKEVSNLLKSLDGHTKIAAHLTENERWVSASHLAVSSMLYKRGGGLWGNAHALNPIDASAALVSNLEYID